MALPYPISPSQTDAKSPVDETLMESFRANQVYLDNQITSGSILLNWLVDGPLRNVSYFKRAIASQRAVGQFVPSVCRATLKTSGVAGALKFDIRKHVQLNIPIVGIDYLYNQQTQSIQNIAPALATTSITRATSQISTQTITLPKASISITSIIKVLGTNRWRINLAAALDNDWTVGSWVSFTGATAGGNNLSAQILEVNQSGYPSVVITNAAGVEQLTANGSAQLQIFSYNQTNPVDVDQFIPGEKALFAGHTDANNNGSFEIYKVNSLGNNIWVKKQSGSAQGAAAGTVDTLRFKYTFAALAPAILAIGEKAKMASHTSGVNNGNFRITGLNVGGNNVVVYNEAGVVQAGNAGTVNTNRWVYALPTDPSTQVSIGDSVQLESHTTAANNFVVPVVDVKYSGNNNVVVYNESGVQQVGIAGFVRTLKKAVKFGADQSINFSLGSFIEITNTSVDEYNTADHRSPLQVLEINRGGGANYNVIVECAAASIVVPSGYVSTEMRSIFISAPSMAADAIALDANSFSKSKFTNLIAAPVTADTPLGLYLLQIPEGAPVDFSVILQ